MIAKILIPAAGFGTRVGSPPAKELLPDPDTARPLIERSLGIARDLRVEAVVITRHHKQELCRYLSTREGVSVMCIEESREWPHSLLLAESEWGDRNVVVLPDTRFAPQQAPSLLLDALQMHPYAFATFTAENLSSWGCLSERENRFEIAEKPGKPRPESRAWGVFAFRRTEGKALLEAMQESCFDHEWKTIHGSCTTVLLEEFCDLTRGRTESS